MDIISLYSGADNLGDGCIQAGHNVKIAVEYNPKNQSLSKDACETIRLNHPDCEVIHMPVSDVLSTLPKCDAVVGGPPCPEFSRANTKRTFDLCEVNNFRKAVELTKAKYYFMENVQDLYKVHRERNFLINCADYGVPQTRIRRIFTNMELPQPTHARTPSGTLFGEPLKKWVSVREALGLGEGYIEDRKTVFGEYPSEKNNAKFRRYSVDRPSKTLTTDDRDYFISNTGFGSQNRENITKSIDEPADTIVTASSMMLTDYPIKSKKKIRNKTVSVDDLKAKNPIWFKKHPPTELDNPSNTILSRDRTTPNEYITDGKFARKLSNEELAILQGFRADFQFYGSKTSVRKQIGNALPAAVSKAFFSLV